ncbi:MAG: NADH:flavin oxidoreductase/NADH oxidase [Betaproteobacteria bacterium]|nr:NADH:flavin oxidoreductase/NADH oxidase [Betaproteobacteria bacterium]MDE2622883.1 NADH:flavin oxidoreductase/NADH oxidase [Betaproteobacteria bacterium]
MSHLFSPLTLSGMTLSNRVVISPMCQYSAQDGAATDWHLMHLGKLAISGAAMVIVEATAVTMEGRITPYCLALTNDAQEAAMARVLRFCRQHSQARMAVQLAHSGRKGSARRPWEPGPALTAADGGWIPEAPSAIPYSDQGEAPHAMTEADLERVKSAFVAATRRALRLGFDAIEVHGAHGYLLHEFLSPLTNQRTDAYGGSLENRLRYPLEVFQAMRAVWPDDRPMGVRLSAVDWAEGGITLDDTVYYASEFRKAGADWLDVSSGGLVSHQKITVGPGYQVPFSERVRRETGAPTMAVGLITEAQQAEDILARGQADLIAIARAALRNPHWAWHAADALGERIAVAPQYERAR